MKKFTKELDEDCDFRWSRSNLHISSFMMQLNISVAFFSNSWPFEQDSEKNYTLTSFLFWLFAIICEQIIIRQGLKVEIP